MRAKLDLTLLGPHEIEIPAIFPRLAAPESYEPTSVPSSDYNCIAWAAERNDDWWWPDEDSHWPVGYARVVVIDSFIAVFFALGYRRCKSDSRDWGYRKVAIYVDDQGTPTHMARQLENGQWTSKLGHIWDISHPTLEHLYDSKYGKVSCFLRRRTVSWPLAILLSLVQGAWRIVSWLYHRMALSNRIAMVAVCTVSPVRSNFFRSRTIFLVGR